MELQVRVGVSWGPYTSHFVAARRPKEKLDNEDRRAGRSSTSRSRLELWRPEGHHKTLGLSNEMPLASALQNGPLVQCFCRFFSAARAFASTEGSCIGYCLFAPAESSQADRVY